jgi:hypothetical protein
MELPFEMFSVFMAMSLVFVGLGIIKQAPIGLFIAGIFILFVSVITTEIDMGALATTLTDTSSTVTDVTYTPNNFEFTQEIKVMFALTGTFLIMMSLMIAKNKE